MAPARLLERNVRMPKRTREAGAVGSEDEEEAIDRDAVDVGSEDEDEMSSGSDVEEGEDDQDLSEEDESQDDVSGDAESQITSVSFGALKQAHDTLSRKRKRGSDESPEEEDKLEVLRKRLRHIKEQKATSASHNEQRRKPTGPSGSIERAREVDAGGGEDEDEDSDSAPSEEDAPSKARTSKHAPAAQSSRHQVTRKRIVVDVPKRVVRDPRFDALQQHSAHQGNSEKAYSFLVDYQKAEIAELKAALKRTKSEDEKVTLRRKINSMENKLKAKASKDREQEVLRQHRREEKEKVQQGKTPYYLKKKDLKERALVEKFKGMKGKDREKLVEKRRRKESQKEKKRMPNARRATG